MATRKVYSYSAMVSDLTEILDTFRDEICDLGYDYDCIQSKLDDFKASLDKKAEYSATHKTSKAKGASAETLEKADRIKSVLGSEPMTSAEINSALRSDYTALQIANAIKYIPGVVSSKVIRKTRNSKGLLCEKEYTAYSL